MQVANPQQSNRVETFELLTVFSNEFVLGSIFFANVGDLPMMLLSGFTHIRNACFNSIACHQSKRFNRYIISHSFFSTLDLHDVSKLKVLAVNANSNFA